ncbi:MAG TPA: glycerol-3-phosphate 1-O-acyltransferase PlsY [Candidatus Saccharimonadales bacterium]|nr:glycerol-3-phosphate 1-O-acyltransferase PlsY [Candidatus Saccharimonadales bacterium]
MRAALLLVTAYFLGSLPWALWAARLRRVDLRAVGSGNLGATNVYRALGPAWGVGVLALDMGKGALAVALARGLGAGGPAWLPPAALVVAVLGHVFTVFAGFRGGKGVATGLGGFLALVPLAGGIAVGAWVVLFALTRMVSAASLAAFVALPVATWLTQGGRADYPYLVVLTVGVAVLVWWRHRGNICRILAGEEHRLGSRR